QVGAVAINHAVAAAPTVRGVDSNRVAPPAEEPRNLELALEAAKRVMGLGAIANVDAADPVIGRVVQETIVVITKLGAGGMGTVYLAIDTQEGLHDRRYALKVLGPDVSTEETERFKREVSAAGRIRSKRVVQVFRHGAFRDRRPWMLMEFVEGDSLEAEIRR